MKRRNVVVCGLAFAVFAGILGVAVDSAHAIKPFSDEFVAKYVKKDSKEKKDVDFAKLVAEAKCNVCHMKGKTKKERNLYGAELSKLLDRREDKDNKDKIISVLVKVEKLPTDPKNKKSPTFGQLIKEGKLPGGTPKEEDEEEK